MIRWVHVACELYYAESEEVGSAGTVFSFGPGHHRQLQFRSHGLW